MYPICSKKNQGPTRIAPRHTANNIGELTAPSAKAHTNATSFGADDLHTSPEMRRWCDCRAHRRSGRDLRLFAPKKLVRLFAPDCLPTKCECEPSVLRRIPVGGRGGARTRLRSRGFSARSGTIRLQPCSIVKTSSSPGKSQRRILYQ